MPANLREKQGTGLGRSWAPNPTVPMLAKRPPSPGLGFLATTRTATAGLQSSWLSLRTRPYRHSKCRERLQSDTSGESNERKQERAPTPHWGQQGPPRPPSCPCQSSVHTSNPTGGSSERAPGQGKAGHSVQAPTAGRQPAHSHLLL